MTTRDLLPFRPPSLQQARLAYQGIDAWFQPTFAGLEHLDAARPALYVGNHTLFGYDVPALVIGTYLHKQIWMRGVADRVHFRVPLWGRGVTRFGGFNGTRESVSTLMQARQHILIFPGGGREVMKNKGEAYQLIWKNRVGFIELALQHGYDIIPFAAHGGEEAFDLRYDSNDFKASLLGKAAQKTGLLRHMRDGEAFVPLATGLAGLPFVPRRQPLHFEFLPRIETKHIPIDQHDQLKWQLREQLAQQIQAQLRRCD
jgi:1-acyl-sn-glycerol-3-phosphate acyltransferase